MYIKPAFINIKQYLIIGASVSIVYTIAFHLQTLFMMLRISNAGVLSSQWLGISFDFALASSSTAILFATIWPFRWLRQIIVPMSFLFGATAAYFSIEMNRVLSCDVIRDFLNVENDLSIELITAPLVAAIVVGISGCFLVLKYASKIMMFYENRKLYRLVINLMITISMISIIFDMSFRSEHLKSASKNYMPFSFFVNLEKYVSQTKKFAEANNYKHDLSKEFSWSYKDDDPITVVFVIGESVRGDKLGLNGFDVENTPRLSSEPNLISFRNFWSLYSTTKYAIPTMLTRITTVDPEIPISEKSFISIYRSLGFQTAWIGLQGIYGQYDHTYGSIALEASEVTEKSEIKPSIDNKKYDGYLLPLAERFLKNSPHDNKLLVLHMIGSHWPFDKRYPDEFRVFKPVCTGAASNCSNDEVMNSYHNSILYSDSVLSELIGMLKDKNAILIFSSDHGVSFDDDGAFGAESLANQPSLHVGTFVWLSDTYMQKNRLKVGKLRNVSNERHTHSNLFHTILGCSNIESEAIDPNLNLCN